MKPVFDLRLITSLWLVTCAITADVCRGDAQLPPLTPEQIIELESADDDDRLWSETAFYALIENTRLWSNRTNSSFNAPTPDLAKLLAEPELHRGELYELRGRIEQQTRLPAPYADVFEWFLRDEDGQPVQVFVINPKIASPGLDFSEGSQVVLPARFYKRTGDIDRSGRRQQYAAFVGALPRPDVPTTRAQLLPLWGVAGLLGGLLLIFSVLFVYVRHLRRTSRHTPGRPRSGHLPEIEDAESSLPDDPAEALVELHRRSGERRK